MSGCTAFSLTFFKTETQPVCAVTDTVSINARQILTNVKIVALIKVRKHTQKFMFLFVLPFFFLFYSYFIFLYVVLYLMLF